MNNITHYFTTLFESLIGRTQQKLNWYEDRYNRAMDHIDFLHESNAQAAKAKPAKKATMKPTIQSVKKVTINKATVSKPVVKKANKPSGN